LNDPKEESEQNDQEESQTQNASDKAPTKTQAGEFNPKRNRGNSR
jgi:hypothetical protein